MTDGRDREAPPLDPAELEAIRVRLAGTGTTDCCWHLLSTARLLLDEVMRLRPGGKEGRASCRA